MTKSAFMRKVYFPIFLLALLLLLVGCQDQMAEAPVSTPTPTPAAATPVPTPSPTPTPTPEPTNTSSSSKGWVRLDEVDLSSYEGELSPEEWEALSGFFPVLNNEVPMLAAHISWDGYTTTPKAEVFLRDIYKDYYPYSDTAPEWQIVSAFALAPVVGEETDLTLELCSLGGWYLLIHREGEQFYALYLPCRWFQRLQTDGLYSGSAGAPYTYFYRLQFSDGTFTEKLLANTDWDGDRGYYLIGGQEVTEEEFFAWQEETLVGDAIWYPARAREQ